MDIISLCWLKTELLTQRGRLIKVLPLRPILPGSIHRVIAICYLLLVGDVVITAGDNRAIVVFYFRVLPSALQQKWGLLRERLGHTYRILELQ